MDLDFHRSFEVVNPCEQDWTFNFYNKKCYKLVNMKKSYNKAKEHCKFLDVNAHLPSVPDEETNDFIKKLAGGDNIWLRAVRLNPGSVFDWADGSGTKSAFIKW